MHVLAMIGIFPTDRTGVHDIAPIVGTAVLGFNHLAPAFSERRVKGSVGCSGVGEFLYRSAMQFHIEGFDIDRAILGMKASRRVIGVARNAIVLDVKFLNRSSPLRGQAFIDAGVNVLTDEFF